MLFHRPTILVEVSPGRWTFSSGMKSWSGDSVVYLDQASVHGVVTGIGTPPPDAGRQVAVPLFDESATPVDKGMVLEAFVRHGLRQVLGRSFFQPRAQIRGVSSLHPCLHGYERLLIRTAFVTAGMRPEDVEFVP